MYELNVNKIEHLEQLLPFIKQLEEHYPDTEKWFDKVKAEILGGTGIRDLITVVYGARVVGMAILKNTEEEKKVCSIMVSPEHSGRGIGKLILDMAFIILRTKHPLITVNSVVYAVSSLKYLLKGMGFIYSKTVKNLYKDGEDELFFNW